MTWVVRGLKALYNFVVGDPVLLVGVTVLFLAVGALARAPGLAPLRPFLPILLVPGILATLVGSLIRETRKPKD